MMKMNNKKPGPVKGEKANTIVEGTILGIQCGWDKTVIPPEQVYDLAVLGLNNKEIARFYNVSDATIARNFAAELQKGREMTKIKLRRAMMKNACEHMNAAVQIFLAKSVLGLSESGNSEETVLPWVESAEEESNEESTQQPNGA
jgi:hypothetical protein